MGNRLVRKRLSDANGGVYPTDGSAWQGTPLVVAPAAPYFVPLKANAPTAQGINWALDLRDGYIEALDDWTMFADVLNLGAAVAFSSISAYSNAGLQWCDALGVWLASVTNNTGPHNYTYCSTDGVNWQQFASEHSTGDGAPIAWVSMPNGQVIAFLEGVFVQTYALASGAWNGATAGPSGFSNLALADAQSVFLFETASFTTGIVWLQNGPFAIATSFDNGTTWTAGTVTTPSGFGGNSPVFRAVAPGLCLLFAGSGAYLSSTDGLTWTTQAHPTYLSGEIPVGADYDAVNGVFYLLLTSATAGPGSTPQSRLLSSTTGLAGSWTAVKTFGFEAQGLAGFSGLPNGRGAFACSGGELAVILKVAGLWRVIVGTTSNVGGSWGLATAPVFANAQWIHAEGSGWIFSDGNANYSLSEQMGTPTSPLL